MQRLSGLPALGNIMHDGVEQGSAIALNRGGIDLDIAQLAGGEPMLKIEIVAFFAERPLPLQCDLFQWQDVELVDGHPCQL